MKHWIRRILAAVVVGVVALSVSCGFGGTKLPESGATLEGKVIYKGEPLKFAMILVTTQGGSATGVIDDDGKYTVSNVPLGDVKIGVNTSAARGHYQSKIMSQNPAAADPKKSKKISAPKFVDVPQKYFDPETSGITRKIEKGVNTFDIEIK